MSDTASTAPRVPKRVAAVILNSLKGGVVPRIGLPYITVGREVEIRALLTDLSLIADGGASFRFLVGRYGAGKSFLLQTIRTHAMGEGFVVADADLSPERRLQGGQSHQLGTRQKGRWDEALALGMQACALRSQAADDRQVQDA